MKKFSSDMTFAGQMMDIPNGIRTLIDRAIIYLETGDIEIENITIIPLERGNGARVFLTASAESK